MGVKWESARVMKDMQELVGDARHEGTGTGRMRYRSALTKIFSELKKKKKNTAAGHQCFSVCSCKSV